LGCYTDTNNRILANYLNNASTPDCYKLAQSTPGATMFGLEFAQGSEIGQCYAGSNANYASYAPSTGCTAKDYAGNVMGSDPWAIALYSM
jgi:hypothetical protein